MQRGLNPFDVLLAGAFLLLLDPRRNGLDLLPNVLGFAALLSGALMLRQTMSSTGEARLLEGALGASAAGVLLSIPLVSVAGERSWVLPSTLPVTLDASLVWGALACMGLANGLLLLALRARVRVLGGNGRFERAAGIAAVFNLAAPLLGLALEVAVSPIWWPWHAPGTLALSVTLVGVLAAIFQYWEVRVLWTPPRPGPRAATVTADRWR